MRPRPLKLHRFPIWAQSRVGRSSSPTWHHPFRDPRGAQAVDPQILEHVKAIVRRDLKLGAAARIPDDMPFFGGDVDMDSLDILLLVTSLEKEFGIKVPNAAVGRQVFENVQTLATFVQEQKATGGVGGPPPVDYLARL